jgi:hypothetical protein
MVPPAFYFSTKVIRQLGAVKQRTCHGRHPAFRPIRFADTLYDQ